MQGTLTALNVLLALRMLLPFCYSLILPLPFPVPYLSAAALYIAACILLPDPVPGTDSLLVPHSASQLRFSFLNLLKFAYLGTFNFPWQVNYQSQLAQSYRWRCRNHS